MTIFRALTAGLSRFPKTLPQAPGRGSLYGAGNLLSGGGTDGMAAYKSIGAAYGPIRRLCQSVALTDWNLYRQSDKAGQTQRELVDDATAPAHHPATALWTQPNPYMTRRFFLYLTQLWKTTGGGVYWVIVQGGAQGSPYPQRGLTADLQLWPVRADKLTPIPGADMKTYVAGYEYSNGIERIPVPAEAVIPIGWPDPLDPLRFAGPLQSIMPDLESETYAAQYQRNLFMNGARPGGVIQFETPLPQDRFDELVLRWREQHQGINNAARVAIIEGGKWVDVGQTNTDMEYEKLRKLDRETVMFALGMPFAVMQTNDINLANATMADKQYYRWTLRPELEDVKEPLNERVLWLMEDNLTMDYELPAPEDEAFDVFASTTGWLTGALKRNEAREAMGYDADGDWDGYITDLPNAGPIKPPTVPPPRMPRVPTRLSYGQHKDADALAAQAAPMEDAWTRRLHQVRESYLALLAQRNGTH